MAIVTFNAISLFSTGVEPIVAAELSSDLGLLEHQVGAVLSTEFAGTMLASFPALWWTRRVSARFVAVLAAALFFGANLASAHYSGYVLLLLWRALAGLAEGTLLILTLSIAARAAHPTRLYGWWVVGQTLVAAAGLLIFPRVFSRLGVGAIYEAMAVGVLLALPLAGCFSARHSSVIDSRDTTTAGRQIRLPGTLILLAVMFMYYVVAGGVWAFAADRGRLLHIEPDTIGSLLGVAYLISLAGAALAAASGIARRSRNLAFVGHLGLGLALVPFAVAMDTAAFALFAVVLQLAWAFTAPLLMTLAAEIEPAGSMMPATTFVVGAGLMVGPLLGGYLFELRGGPAILSVCFGAVVGVSALLLMFHSNTRSVSS